VVDPDSGTSPPRALGVELRDRRIFFLISYSFLLFYVKRRSGSLSPGKKIALNSECYIEILWYYKIGGEDENQYSGEGRVLYCAALGFLHRL